MKEARVTRAGKSSAWPSGTSPSARKAALDVTRPASETIRPRISAQTGVTIQAERSMAAITSS